MKDIEFIFIAQSETIDYGGYSKLPADRIELYRDLVYPRMVYFKGAFRSHLDLINYFTEGKFFNEAGYAERRKLLNMWNLPGMNSLHLANYLAQYGIAAKVINNFDAEWDIFRDAYGSAKRPPIVGISTTFHLSYMEAKRIAGEIRKEYPDAVIALGGAFVNEQSINGELRDMEKPMRKYGINYILHAFNSEADLRDLVLASRKGALPGSVNNLAYLGGGDLKSCAFGTTGTKWNDPVLEDDPELWDKLDMKFVNHTVQTRTSYGCPFSCAFCSYPKTAKKFCQMDIDAVEKQVNGLLKIPGVDKIIFVDDTFNASPARFKDICRSLGKYNFEWFAFLRANLIDEETARLMVRSGCRGVYLGIESADDAVLKNMNKKATHSQCLEGIRFLKKYGVTTVAAFIIGFPGETEETLKEDVEFIESSGVDFYTLKEFYYMKHTAVYEDRGRFGLSGIGNKWRHDTMDYKKAQAAKIDMFRSIKNSVYVDADTSLWYIAYLYDQGYDISRTAAAQRRINGIAARQIDGMTDDNDRLFKELGEILSKEAVRK
ncbi:MAG: radical SAM protein [Candidatus Omnitrophota bacterium]|nr:radical SAM protein [Candidatus Omnitrophota bacterium]